MLSEACFLLGRSVGTTKPVFDLLRRGLVTAPFRLEDHLDPVSRLMTKYASVPMPLAHACLVRMAELYADSRLLTVDADFRLYRKQGRQVIPLLIPEGM